MTVIPTGHRPFFDVKGAELFSDPVYRNLGDNERNGVYKEMLSMGISIFINILEVKPSNFCFYMHNTKRPYKPSGNVHEWP